MIYAGMIWLLDSLLTWRSGKLTRSESSPEKSHANVEFARVKPMIAHPRSRFQPAYGSILNGIIYCPCVAMQGPLHHDRGSCAYGSSLRLAAPARDP